MENENLYGYLCSLFYDIDKPLPDQKELDFYLSFVNKNMNILEPMCGSGRFLVSFIEKGFNIDGFDISKEMLERCKSKIDKLKIKNSSKLECCSFNTFPISRKYDFIFIPSGSFSLFTNSNDINENLKILEMLSSQNGKIVIELEVNENMDGKKVSESYSKSKTVKKDNNEIVLYYKTVKVDKNEKVIYSMLKYELYNDDKFIRDEEQNFNLKYYAPFEFEKYLDKTLLKIKNKYMNYEKEKYSNQKTDKIIYELVKE